MKNFINELGYDRKSKRVDIEELKKMKLPLPTYVDPETGRDTGQDILSITEKLELEGKDVKHLIGGPKKRS